MSLPGFGAESSLYRSSGHYQMAVGAENSGGIAVAITHPPHPLCNPILCSASGGVCVGWDVWGYNVCCPKGQVCGDVCCPTGQFCLNFGRWGGICSCPDIGQTCGDLCCPQGQSCYEGCCLANPGELRFNSNANYLIANCTDPNCLGDYCKYIQGLKVKFQVGTEDMVAVVTPYDNKVAGSPIPNGGFDIQLNANPPFGYRTTGMQYIFEIRDNVIRYQVQYYADGSCVYGCASPRIEGVYVKLDSNTIPAGYVFEIDLTNDKNTGGVTGGTFTVTDNQGNPTTPQAFKVDPGYQYPISAFQVNIVGPNDSSCSEFSSGGGILGTLTYTTDPVERLCVKGGSVGVCGSTKGFTCELSNATYGPIGPPCCNTELSQSVSFSTAIACPSSNTC